MPNESASKAVNGRRVGLSSVIPYPCPKKSCNEVGLSSMLARLPILVIQARIVPSISG